MARHTETLTSRERLLRALDHQQPDRVPIDLGGNQTGIHKLAYQALLEHLQIEDELRIMDAVQQLARPCEAVLERLRVDTRYIHAGAAAGFQGGIVTRQRGGQTWHDLTDEFGITWSMPDDMPLYMDISHHPLADATHRRHPPVPVSQAATRAASPDSASGPCSSATKRPTPSSAGSAAWSTRSAGTSAGWNAGSWT